MVRPTYVSVRAEGDLRTRLAESCEISGLNAVGLLHVGAIRGRGLELCQLAGRYRFRQPGQVRRDTSIGQVGDHDERRTLFHHPHKLVVHIAVSDAVRKGIEPGFQQSLRVIPRPAVRRRAPFGGISFLTWRATSPVSWPRLITTPTP